MTAVPSLDGPLTAPAVTTTAPGPVPSLGDTESHGTLLAAVHGHPAVVVTVTVLLPPVANTFCAAGAMEKVQPSDCVTLNRWPAMVRDPLRGGPVAPATSNITAPLPRPSLPERIWIHESLDVAVHGHKELEARPSTRPDPPSGVKLAELVASVMSQVPASCVISARCPFTTRAPRRDAGSGLRAAANSTIPSPWPLCPDLTDNHPLSAEAVQVHSRVAAIATVPVPPLAGTI